MAQHYSEEMDDAATRPQDVDVTAEQRDAGQAEQGEKVTPRPKRARSGGTRRRAKGTDTPLRALPEPAADEDQHEALDEHEAEMVELEAKGFTRDEAIRLIHTSARLAQSSEVREAEAAMRRLRFTRWLIEHGVLNEFTA